MILRALELIVLAVLWPVFLLVSWWEELMRRTCCYWLAGNEKQCGKPCKYKIKLDDDGNKYRDYDAFCPEHRKIVDSQPREDDEEEL